MLNDVQLERMLGKLRRYEKTMEPLLFTDVGELETRRFETAERLHEIPPDNAGYTPIRPGDTWGGERMYCWLRGTAVLPEACQGRDVFLKPVTGAYETLLWVDGVPSGNLTRDTHPEALIARNARSGQAVDIALACYAGHYIIGTQPFETDASNDFVRKYLGVRLCVKNDDIVAFLLDLRTLNQLAEALDVKSFRRAEVLNCLTEVHKTVWYDPDSADESLWRPALARAREIMRPVLAQRNGSSAPLAGLVGHSHMDTAWLWPIAETLEKCARTYSNQISLMDQYPDYRFIQSSAYHGALMQRHYPKLFGRIRQMVAEGRYEPNGGVWVECDCNITSGESMVRQFLWGQRFTREQFGYTSNCFWLPDTFGYSAAIPQIMKGCGVDYFLTTKLSWNDTNRFPYETFVWRGIDGTSVFAHFNVMPGKVNPSTLIESLCGSRESSGLQQKRVAPMRLVAYGYGDGGGGPTYDSIEMAGRLRDLDGCPRAEHIAAGDFMKELERVSVDPPVYAGELYFEMHRGTLTNQHEIKRNNRKAEQALHDLEAVTVMRAAAIGAVASGELVRPLMETLLVNQFHDILPGTCIAEAHDQCHIEMAQTIDKAGRLIRSAIDAEISPGAVTVVNTLGFDRIETVAMDVGCMVPEDGSLPAQIVEDMDGNRRLSVSGIRLPALGSVALKLKEGTLPEQPCAFVYEDEVLTTPFARVAFAPDGAITSFVDTRARREIRGDGLPLNTFLMAEDVPTGWDNWDIDADYQMKLEPVAELLDRRVIGCGSVEFRIRSTYRLSPKSMLRQDMVFYASTPRVDFETEINWRDKHRFLKVGFHTNVAAPYARHEIQFGCAMRPTTRNTTWEQARFEVVNHKYTDLSETRFGVAMLNDCKYGVSVEGGDIRLSLHKGGTRPDPRGDAGVHRCVYSLLPHAGGFSAETVVRPAYALNYRPILVPGRMELPSLACVDAPNIIIEAVKPCEDTEKAFILRLYEAEGSRTHARLSMGVPIRSVEITNMLEEPLEALPLSNNIALEFRPFEIKTLKISYGAIAR